MRSQVTGLAQAIAKTTHAVVTEKTVALKKWSSWIPAHLNPAPFRSLEPSSSELAPPWPDILITCGRRSAALSIAIGKKSQGRTYRVHIQNPQIPSHHFNLVCAMIHDGITGQNVITIKTALHKLSHEKLAQESQLWAPRWSIEHNTTTNAPILGIILGGKTKQYGFSQERLQTLIEMISNATYHNNAKVLLTPSGRTEAFVKTELSNKFKNHPNVWIWDQNGANPYQAILGQADHLLVTADSVSMISEALYTTKPVHIFPLSGTSRRHQLFLDILTKDKLIHPISKNIDFSVNARPEAIDETTKIAHTIRQNFKHHLAKLR